MKKTKTTHNLPYTLEDTYILPFGTFYFYEAFVVSEVDTNVVFDKSMTELLLFLVVGHYGAQKHIGYISHRLNNYTVNKNVLSQFLGEEQQFIGFATVPASKESFWSRIKKDGTKTEQFNSLLEAASWITSLNILIKHKKIKKDSKVIPFRNIAYFL